MTPTEFKLLKIIWRNRGKASAAKIARELKISADYVRLICGVLLKNKIIDLSQARYELTRLGRKELEKLGVVEKKKKKKKVTAKVKKRACPRASKAKKLIITDLSDISRDLKEALKREGLWALEDIAPMNVTRLMEVIEVLSLKQAVSLINKARDKLRKNGKEYLWE